MTRFDSAIWAQHNYIDAEVRAHARMHGMSANEMWELRVTRLAMLLARTLSERESNSEDFKIEVDPVGNAWNWRLKQLIDERTRTLSKEEFLERLDG